MKTIKTDWKENRELSQTKGIIYLERDWIKNGHKILRERKMIFDNQFKGVS